MPVNDRGGLLPPSDKLFDTLIFKGMWCHLGINFEQVNLKKQHQKNLFEQTIIKI